jgi:hypothetical protein
MENKKSNLVLAGLKFSKAEIGEACGNESNTKLAVWLVAFSVLLDTVIAFFKGNGGSSGLARMGLTGFDAAISEMGSALIGTFLSALIMVYVIRIFKAKSSYAEILRVYGAAIIWAIMGSLFGLVPGLRLIGIVFWLAYNFSLLFGLTGYVKTKIWQSFLSIVLTFAVVFGVMMLYGLVIGAVFG